MATSDVIPHYPPNLGREEIELVESALSKGWVSYGGRYVSEFEEALCEAAGFRHAVTLASGTCALQIALEILGQEGAEVVLPALSFVAPASAVVRSRMFPVFVDIDPTTWQLDFDALEAFIREECAPDSGQLINLRSGRRIAGICLVHLWGDIADIGRAHALAKRYGLFVVHDAAQAMGARYWSAPLGTAIGTLPAGAVAATSFNANKIITTGAGGALLSNDEAFAREAKHLASTAKVSPDEFVHDRYGVNYRLSNLNAAVGLGQIRKLEQFLSVKRRHRDLYMELLGRSGLRLSFPKPPLWIAPNYWALALLLDRPARPIIAELTRRSIQARPVWVPLPRLLLYSQYTHVTTAGVADQVHATGLMLPSGSNLEENDVRRVVAELLEVMQ